MKLAEKIRFYTFSTISFLFYIAIIWSVMLLPIYIYLRLYKHIVLSLLIIALSVYETAINPSN